MSPAKIMQNWWEDRAKRRLGLITAAFVALITIANFGEVAKPYWFVMQYQLEASFQKAEVVNAIRFLELQIATKESARDNIQAQLDRLQYEISKNADAPDSLKRIINEQIRRYTEQLRLLNNELDDLYRARSKRRP